MKGIIWSALLVCTSVFAGNPERDYIPIPENRKFVFARSLQGNSEEKSPIEHPYRLARYPVTNAEYAAFCKATGHRTPPYWRNGKFPKGKGRHPVQCVSIEDVKAYCLYLEERHPGCLFRLPTEAEWENAAAGPKHQTFPWGNSDRVCMKAGRIVSPFNFNAVAASCLAKSPCLKVTFTDPKSKRKGESVLLRDLLSVNEHGQVQGWIDPAGHTGFVCCDLFRKLWDEGGFTTAVDAYPEGRSHHGCFDMAGNVWEWTSTKITATRGEERGKYVNAVRGGSWYSDKNSCRTDVRGEGRNAEGRYHAVGFRLVAVRLGSGHPGASGKGSKSRPGASSGTQWKRQPDAPYKQPRIQNRGVPVHETGTGGVRPGTGPAPETLH